MSIDERFAGMTEEQIANLSDEEIAAIVDYECAEAGIKLVPPLPEPPAQPTPPDLVLYHVPDMIFINRDDAEKVRAMAMSMERCTVGCVSWDWNGPQIKKPPEDILISEKVAYSRTAYDQRKVELERYTADKKRYDAAIKEHEDAVRGRKSVVDEVRERINEASEAVYMKQRLRATFAQYLALAKGDREMALAFMRKVHTLPEGWEPETETPPASAPAPGAGR